MFTVFESDRADPYVEIVEYLNRLLIQTLQRHTLFGTSWQGHMDRKIKNKYERFYFVSMILSQEGRKEYVGIVCVFGLRLFKTKLLSGSQPCTEIQLNLKRHLQSSRFVCPLVNQFNICWTLWYFFFNILAHFKYTTKIDHFFLIHTFCGIFFMLFLYMFILKGMY